MKIVTGVILILIYSRFYTVRNTTDAFKYYDDAKVIYAALYSHPIDYIRITFGINSGAADLFPYYQKMNNWFLGDNYTLYNDSRSVIRFNALVFPFSNNHYSVHIIVMCFISLCGLTALYKAFYPFFATKQVSLIFSVFLIPSVLFWGSGVLKEGLILFASGFLIYYFFKLLKSPFSLKNCMLFLMFCFFMLGIKVHVLFALIPGFVILFWHSKFLNPSLFSKTLIIGLLGIVGAISISSISEKYSPFRMLAQKQKDFINIANGGFYFEQIGSTNDTFYVKEKNRLQISLASDSSYWKFNQNLMVYKWKKGDIIDTLQIGKNDSTRYRFLMHLDSSGSKINIPKLAPNIGSILKNIPVALANTFFRPTVFESKNYLSLFASLENLLILALFVISIFYFKKPSAQELEVFIFCSSFVFILFSIIGLTTPVLGALVRYKIPALPYLFMLFRMCIDSDKLIKQFPILRKLQIRFSIP
ncbi:MAG: hypothetical protein IPP32_14870 [Bacteroidetes bacterium]|nr:hypothetical protein [Bacteroidota bacterium]